MIHFSGKSIAGIVSGINDNFAKYKMKICLKHNGNKKRDPSKRFLQYNSKACLHGVSKRD